MDRLAIANELDKQVRANYEAAIVGADWREYVKVGKQKNFGGDVHLQKYGAQFSLVESDNISERDISERASHIAMAAIRTESCAATRLFVSENGPHPSLFGSPIGNISNLWRGTWAILNPTNLQHALTLLSGVERFDLVVPGPLRADMDKALTALDDERIAGHVNPWIRILDRSDSVDVTWYLFGRKADDSAVCVNFLEGHETPEVLMNAKDSSKFIVRHLLGGAQRDPSCALAFVGIAQLQSVEPLLPMY